MAIGTIARGLLVLVLASAPGRVVGFGLHRLQQQRWSKPVASGVKQPPAQALGSAASSSTDLQGVSGT